MSTFQGRVFQTEGTAIAKALRMGMSLLCSRNQMKSQCDYFGVRVMGGEVQDPRQWRVFYK